MVAGLELIKAEKENLRQDVFGFFDNGMTINHVAKTYEALDEFYPTYDRKLQTLKNWYTAWKKVRGVVKRTEKISPKKPQFKTPKQIKEQFEEQSAKIESLAEKAQQPLQKNLQQVQKFVRFATQIQEPFQFAPLNEVMNELLARIKISAQERKHYEDNILPVKQTLYTQAFHSIWQDISDKIESGNCKFDQNFMGSVLTGLKLGEDLAKSYESSNVGRIINNISQTLQVEKQAIKNGHVKDAKEEFNNIEAEIAQVEDIND